METNSLHRNKGSTNRSEGSLVVLLIFEIMLIQSALLWTPIVYNCTIHDRIDLVFNKVIRKVRKRRHWNPLFGHIGDEISKNRKKKKYTGLQGGMKLSLAENLMLN
jgi:hypothetical protein